MGVNPGVEGADFDRSVLYEDRFAPETLNFSEEEIRVDMDPDLKSFLREHARLDRIYIQTMLVWNGIKQYLDFKVLSENQVSN